MLGESPDRQLDDVLIELDVVIDRAREDRSALGIFPAMYRSVTADIRRASHGGFFNDGERLERFAVAFADRYLDAYRERMASKKPTESWDVAFNAATDGRRRMVAQHLLAGMNAHINLDLGIVAAENVTDDREALRRDFVRVNDILFAKIGTLQDSLNSVSPRLAWVDRMGGRIDEILVSKIIGVARDDAWDLAMEIVDDPDTADVHIADRDRSTAAMGRAILDGPMYRRILTKLLASSEPKDIPRIIDAFAGSELELERLPTRKQEFE